MVEPSGREGVQEILVEREVKDSYLTYAMSVIVSRALPDVRDGLKPSQRRILVAMNDLDLGPRSKYRKCAKIAGDTSGNYHPHGESVIYPTLVRMAQEFNMRYPLVDGQGNFGSIDGDPPAAMRYTESRMTYAALAMMEDLDKETVDFVPNYDDTRVEPTVLPAKLPNLLVNGTSGIAVGMATNIPPHNIKEICEAGLKLIENPETTTDELMEIVKGPDFPTGGLVRGTKALHDAYRTGRGIVVVEGRTHFEETKRGNNLIVVTEIPYQLNKTLFIERISDLVKDGKINGISDLRDESDREGMRIVIELKKGEEGEVVLNQLHEYTQLRDSFGINMVALVEGKPQTLSLRDLIKHYISHRFVIIRRRTRYLLRRAEERLHIVEGLIKAIQNIDDVIATIKASPGVQEAKVSLMGKFGFSELQAVAILEMRLQRLTGLEYGKLKEEYEGLVDKIKEYKDILKQDSLVYDIISEDLHELMERFGDARRTEIVGGEVVELEKADLIAEENVVVTVSHEGYAKRMALDLYRKQGRGGRGITGSDLKEQDFIEHLFVTSTHDYLCLFTNKGKLHWLKVYDIPQLSRTAKGRPLVNLINLTEGEKVQSMIPVRIFDDRYLVLATRKGVIKKTVLSAFGRPNRAGIIAVNLDEGDELIGAAITSGSNEIMLGSAEGWAVRFNEENVRPMGRASRGVRGITLREGDTVVDMIIPTPGSSVLTVCENGFGKRSDFEEYRLTARGGKGVINIKASERNGNVVGMRAVTDADEIMLMSQNGIVIRMAVKDTRVIGRATQGVRLMSLDEGDKTIAVAKVANEEVGDEKTPAGEAKAPTNGGSAQSQDPQQEQEEQESSD